MKYDLKNGKKLTCPCCGGIEWRHFKFGIDVRAGRRAGTEYWNKYTCSECFHIMLFNKGLQEGW